MIIETAFNVGEIAYMMNQNKVATVSVSGINFNSGALDIDDLKAMESEVSKTVAMHKGLTYKVHVADKELYVKEYDLFKTKEDLIQSL